jgi:cell shape-determining protein MreC
MKKTFLVKRNALLSPRTMSWGLFAVACAVLMLIVRLCFPNVFWDIVTPLFRASDAVANETHVFLTSFSDAATLANVNEKTASENVVLADENQMLVQKLADEEALLGASGAQKAQPGILAGVVARPPESPYDTLVLAAGTHAGVALGMEAFGTGDVPIGVVSSVLADFSRVTLFSAPGIVTSGWVGHTSIPLTLVGAGGGVLTASVARVSAVAVGDTVFVPGPGQLPVGSVVAIDSNPLSPGVTLRIMSAFNPFSISWVELRATGSVGVTFATSTLP